LVWRPWPGCSCIGAITFRTLAVAGLIVLVMRRSENQADASRRGHERPTPFQRIGAPVSQLGLVAQDMRLTRAGRWFRCLPNL
jgi:hypothetical protein